MEMVMEKVNDLYEKFMDLSMVKKAVVVLIVGLVVYYAYKHFWLREGMEGGENGVLRFFHVRQAAGRAASKATEDNI